MPVDRGPRSFALFNYISAARHGSAVNRAQYTLKLAVNVKPKLTTERLWK